MQYKKWVLLIVSLLTASIFCHSALAMYPWHPILVMTTGAAFNNDSDSKNFPAHDNIFSFYDYKGHANHGQFIGGIFVGTEFLIQPEYLSLQTGFSYYQPTPLTLAGDVTQGVDVASENTYSYQYSIQSQQVLIESKLLYNVQRYHPYFTAAFGAAFNKSYDYKVDIDPPFTTFSNQFKNNTVTSLMYRIGLGIDIDITKQARLGLGYRYANLGKTETGTGVIDTVSTNDRLSQSRLYTNEILAQYTIIIL